MVSLNLTKKIFLFNLLIILFNSCAYFNTFYNANQYYEEANKIRLEKDGQAVPITAMDKYGKAISKCKKVLKLSTEFEKSKDINSTIANAKPPIFWKEKELVKRQILNWEPNKIHKLILNINNIELQIKKNNSNQINIILDFMFEQSSNKTNNYS